MKKRITVGAGTAAPVGKANENKQGTQGTGEADVSLRELAASIMAYAEAHKSDDPGWSKVKSAAEAVHNGVKSEIARLIRELAEINDTDAQGYQAELSVLLANKNNEDLNKGRRTMPDKANGPLAVPGICALQCFSVPIGKLQVHSRANGKFKIDDKEFAALKANMSEIGFDPRHPIIVVRDGEAAYLVVDGVTRLRAAQELGITEVYVMLTEFKSDESMDYFIATTQLLNRECTDAVLLTVAAIIIPIEERKAKEERQGARNKLATSTHKKAEVTISTSDAVGLILHRSGSTVDKIKKILANPEYSRKVKTDEIKIAGAYREIMAAQRPPKPAETDKPADNADDGDQAPMGSKADDENRGEAMDLAGEDSPLTVEPDARDAGKQNAVTQQDAKAPVAVPPQITRQADDTPATPAIQDNTITLLPVPEKLLAFLLTFAPESSRQKIYGLMTVCPTETREFIKKHLAGVEATSKQKTQSRSNPKDKLTLRTSGKRKPRHKDGTAVGKQNKDKGGEGKTL